MSLRKAPLFAALVLFTLILAPLSIQASTPSAAPTVKWQKSFHVEFPDGTTAGLTGYGPIDFNSKGEILYTVNSAEPGTSVDYADGHIFLYDSAGNLKWRHDNTADYSVNQQREYYGPTIFDAGGRPVTAYHHVTSGVIDEIRLWMLRPDNGQFVSFSTNLAGSPHFLTEVQAITSYECEPERTCYLVSGWTGSAGKVLRIKGPLDGQEGGWSNEAVDWSTTADSNRKTYGLTYVPFTDTVLVSQLNGPIESFNAETGTSNGLLSGITGCSLNSLGRDAPQLDKTNQDRLWRAECGGTAGSTTIQLAQSMSATGLNQLSTVTFNDNQVPNPGDDTDAGFQDLDGRDSMVICGSGGAGAPGFIARYDLDDSNREWFVNADPGFGTFLGSAHCRIVGENRVAVTSVTQVSGRNQAVLMVYEGGGLVAPTPPDTYEWDAPLLPKTPAGVSVFVREARDAPAQASKIEVRWPVSSNDPNQVQGSFDYRIYLDGVLVADPDPTTSADNDGIRFNLLEIVAQQPTTYNLWVTAATVTGESDPSCIVRFNDGNENEFKQCGQTSTKLGPGSITFTTPTDTAAGLEGWCSDMLGDSAGSLFLCGMIFVAVVTIGMVAAFMAITPGATPVSGAIVGAGSGIGMMIFNVFANVWGLVWGVAIILLTAGVIMALLRRTFFGRTVVMDGG